MCSINVSECRSYGFHKNVRRQTSAGAHHISINKQTQLLISDKRSIDSTIALTLHQYFQDDIDKKIVTIKFTIWKLYCMIHTDMIGMKKRMKKNSYALGKRNGTKIPKPK